MKTKLNPIATLVSGLLLCFACCDIANAAEWDIYLIGGQSNAAGWNSSISGLSDPALQTQTDIMFYYEPDQSGSGNNGAWGDLRFGSGRAGSNFGPELTMGRTLADENPSRNIAIIKYAVGGADLASQWNPDDPGDPSDANTGLYDKLIAAINNATSTLPAGDTYCFKGMAWMQGETDAASVSKSAAYEANLTNFIARIRQDLGVADLPFSIGQLGAVPGRDGMGQIQNAQAAIAARDENVSLVITSSFVLQGDNLHFTSASQERLGLGFAAGLQGNLTDIQIANASFESTSQSDGGVNSRNVSGWEQTNISTTGNFNPNTAYYTDTDSLDSNGGEVGSMDANHVLFFANTAQDEHVTQTLSTTPEVGKTYNLTVAVGDRDAGSRPQFAGYLIQLLSDGQVVATSTSPQSPGDGTLTDVTLSYTFNAGDPIGPLGIRLGTNGARPGAATDFDNVRFSIEAPAEIPALPGINWQPSVNLYQGATVESFVSNRGTLAVAYNATNLTGNGAAGVNTTVNGVDFVAAQAPVTLSGTTGESIRINSLSNNEGAFGDGQFGNNTEIFNLLRGGSFNITTMTLGGLRADTIYEVQIFAHDGRSSRANALTAFSNGLDNTIPDLNSALNLNNTNTGDPFAGGTGDYVIGTFTSSSPTLTFSVFGEGDSADSNGINFQSGISQAAINAIQLRAIGTAPGALLGDVNLDGVVDFSDIAPFIALLMSGAFQLEADVDLNGAVDFSDIPPFIAILAGG